MNDIIDFFFKESHILFFSFNKSGDIIEMNDYARRVLKKPENIKIDDIFIDFTEQLDIFHIINNNDYPVLLSINTSHDLPESYYFHFKESKDLYLAFGQMNFSELNYTNKQFVKLNNELNVLTRKLHKQNAELSQLKEIKDQHLGMAAHDLRNPLGNIINFSELLKEKLHEGNNEKNLSFLETIKQQAQFGIELLNETLQVSRLESGNIRLKLISENINKIIKEAIYVNQISAKNKNIELHFQADDNIREIPFDRNALSQVMNNLISNAMKYSHPHTKVTIISRQNDNHVRIDVKDQGLGIPEEDYDKVFKPFSTTSTRPTQDESSSGLGLSIAKKIIEAHSGTIDFNSETGKGSVFYITLPLKQ